MEHNDKLKQHGVRFLQKVRAVQIEFSKHDDGTRSVSAIHRAFIEPVFFISLPTLRRYLDIKLKKQ